MNQKIDSRPSFFPKVSKPNSSQLKSSSNLASLDNLTENPSKIERVNELKELANRDAKVDIDHRIKDFARIKSAVDMAPDLDQSDRIQRLKESINRGEYQFDYDALADRILEQESL
jgi:negative regulator of flagellin synthesis FlgM